MNMYSTSQEGDPYAGAGSNKTSNSITAEIIQPDGVSKVFVIGKIKGTIKYPVENGMAYSFNLSIRRKILYMLY